MRRLVFVFAALAVVAMGLASSGTAAPTGSADLKIAKTASAGSVYVGGSLAYTITVENLGPETATGVTVTDPLPSSVKFASATTTVGSCALQGQKLSCNLGTLEAGATAKVGSATITLTVTPQKAGSVTNTATVSGEQGDPVTANNQASVTTKVVEKAPTPTPPTGATCRGVKATIVGTRNADTIGGTGGRDVIVALGGNDRIYSGAGRDLICAGGGADLASSGSAADRVFGGAGKDRLLGRGGGDVLNGGRGGDLLKGGSGSDRIRGGSGIDTCRGGAGVDSIGGCER
jgi:uncharacterized repeat protein (TIGR01451 family)